MPEPSITFNVQLFNVYPSRSGHDCVDVVQYNLPQTQGSIEKAGPELDAFVHRDQQWRRGGDSNPRNGAKPFTPLAGERLRPLGHLSVSALVGMPIPRQCCSPRRHPSHDHPESSSASAPLAMSRSSIVMALCRARLYSSVRSSITSSALLVALSMATMRAPCSAAFDSRRARHI